MDFSYLKKTQDTLRLVSGPEVRVNRFAQKLCVHTAAAALYFIIVLFIYLFIFLINSYNVQLCH